MLYWAQGAKQRNDLYFVNSDEAMLILFIAFLRTEMLVKNEDITIHIHCHTHDENEKQRIGLYWLNTLGLQQTNLRKIQTKQSGKIRRNILNNGVCGIRVKRGTRLLHHIYGAIQEYAGFVRGDWNR